MKGLAFSMTIACFVCGDTVKVDVPCVGCSPELTPGEWDRDAVLQQVRLDGVDAALADKGWKIWFSAEPRRVGWLCTSKKKGHP